MGCSAIPVRTVEPAAPIIIEKTILYLDLTVHEAPIIEPAPVVTPQPVKPKIVIRDCTPQFFREIKQEDFHINKADFSKNSNVQGYVTALKKNNDLLERLFSEYKTKQGRCNE